ncbi:uncharacterized protein LOC143355620 [Halictus rubicundus]|uniref:uncharacterized protein LOC143355620 n=1 Tax=Halictus rubicundus TaxID=77578 RepID=UPI0040355179
MTVAKISTEMNNEIVLLRQCVRRARICVINKLVREAKRLRANRGNEKLSEKNKNKAEKYLREVSELKRVKDDEISKFGIIHLEDLERMLQNSQTDDRTRAIVKAVRYKCLNEKIMEFVKKFPNCKECVSGNKKERSLKKKRKNSISEQDLKNPKRSPDDQNDSDQHARNNRLSISSVVDEETPLQKLKRNRQDAQSEEDCVKSNEKSSELITKAVSKEATVKRFTDILQESSTPTMDDQNEENKEQQSSPMPMALTRADDFFLNSDKVVAVHVNAAATFSSADVDKKTFTTFPKRSVKREFPRYERNQGNRSQRRREANNKDVSYHQRNTRETSAVFGEQKKRFPEVKEASRNIHETFKKDRTKATENESLHPSWAARRKLQDVMKQGFQGKKIRFEET